MALLCCSHPSPGRRVGGGRVSPPEEDQTGRSWDNVRLRGAPAIRQGLRLNHRAAADRPDTYGIGTAQVIEEAVADLLVRTVEGSSGIGNRFGAVLTDDGVELGS